MKKRNEYEWKIACKEMESTASGERRPAWVLIYAKKRWNNAKSLDDYECIFFHFIRFSSFLLWRAWGFLNEIGSSARDGRHINSTIDFRFHLLIVAFNLKSFLFHKISVMCGKKFLIKQNKQPWKTLRVADRLASLLAIFS